MGLRQTPASTANYTNNTYVDSLALTYDQSIRKPNVDSTLVHPFGNQMISGFCEMTMAMNGIKNNEYIHVEDDYIKEVVKLASNALAGLAGAEVSHTIAAAYKWDASNAGGAYVATGNTTTYPVRVNDVLMFANRVKGLVTSVTGAAYTVVPLNSADAIPAVATTDTIIIAYNLVGEASSQRTSSSKTVFEYKNMIQTLRNDHKVTDRETATETWFDNLGKDGNSSGWYNEAVYNAYKVLMVELEQSMLIGDQVTNTTLADTSGFATVIGSQGLIPWMEAYGNVEAYTAGSFALDDFDSLVAKLVKYEGSRKNTMWTGHTLSVEIDNLMRTTAGLTSGGISYNGTPSDQRSVAFGFGEITYGGFSFDKKHLSIFDKPWGLGADGQKFTNMGLVIPSDNVIVPQFGGGTSSVPSLRLNYLETKGSNMGFRQWETGGLAQIPTSDVAELNVHMTCDRGFEGFAANRYGIFKAN
tara:strand:+ start:9170 stop:10582 length:1413 start_codon:yes stop_codon:yes gene_type:complete